MDKFEREATHVAKIIELLGPKQLTLLDGDVVRLLQELDFRLIHEALCNASADGASTTEPTPEDYKAASVERLREICATELSPGDLWRPQVVAVENRGIASELPLNFASDMIEGRGWYWYDNRNGSPTYPYHGPFIDERNALMDAIIAEGHEEQ